MDHTVPVLRRWRYALKFAALVAMAVQASAQVYVEQIGSANHASIESATPLSARVTMVGSDNLVDVRQSGLSASEVALAVAGSDNVATIQHDAPQAAQLQTQLVQSGAGNVADIAQSAYWAGSQTIALGQWGDFNTAALSQTGGANTISLDQFNTGNTADIAQNGNGLTVGVTQWGGAAIQIVQVGP